MDVVAGQIVDLADDPRVESNPEAQDSLSAGIGDLPGGGGPAGGRNHLPALEDLSDDLDRARWQLDATQALVKERPLPPEPQAEAPIACFFDPTHGAGARAGNARDESREQDGDGLR